MTPHAPLSVKTPIVSQHKFSFTPLHRSLRYVFTSLLLYFAFLPSARSQATQQQYVYASVPTSSTASQVSAFSKDSATGDLTPLPDSPTSDNLEGGVMAVDALGRFLFILNRTSGKISMFHIDPAAGSLLEVPASPFSAASLGPGSPQPAFPSCLAVEPTGQYLYVGYDVASDPGRGAIQSFQIDSANLQLLPLPNQFTTDLNSSPIGLISAVQGRFLYAGLGLNLSTLVPDGETIVFQIDPLTGQLQQNGYAGNAQARGRSIAVDPQSRFFFEAWAASSSQGFIDVAPISPADGTASIGVSTLNLPPNELPSALLAESSGKFLYVQQTTGVATYSINQATGALAQSQPTIQAFTFQNGRAAADPLGPFLYAIANDGIHGFQIDPQAGALSPLPGSPFPVGGSGQQGIAISGSASSVQPVSGPAVSLFPSSQSFGSITAGQPGPTKIVTLTNTGNQLLLISKISIGGLNAALFGQTNTCLAALKSGDTCSVSVTFSPAAAGSYQASLLVADNAPNDPQSVALSGIGLAQQPDVTLAPAALSFPSTNQGSTSQPQSLSITNDGAAPLQITSIAIDPTSANSSDFSLTANTCGATLSVKSTCVLTATFSPRGNGARTANVLVVDNAPGSPQQIPLTGTGSGAPVTHPDISFNPASINFTAAAQTGNPPQTLTITSSGSGTLHIASIQLVGANTGDFAITNNCTGAAYVSQSMCGVSVVFAPLNLGLRTASLIVTDDAPNSPQTIAISGTFTDPPPPQPVSTGTTVSVSGNSPLTVKAGSPASWTLSLTPNFTGTLNFTCTAPASPPITCSVPPASVPVSASVPVPVSITATTGSSAASVLRQLPGANPVNYQPIPVLALLFALLALALYRRSDARDLNCAAMGHPQLLPCAAMAILFVLFTTLSAAGCGGGISSPRSVPVSPAPGPTPSPATYTLTVSVSPKPSDGTPPANIPAIVLSLTVNP